MRAKIVITASIIFIIIAFVAISFIGIPKKYSDMENNANLNHLTDKKETNPKSTNWSVETIHFNIPDKLTRIFFLDSQNGWVAGNNKLYKIDISGKVVEKTEPPIQKNESIVNINFFDLSNGWV